MELTTRVYTEPFTACTFVRIPAIQHGFATEALTVHVYGSEGPEAQRIIPGVVRVWPKTYTVEVIFNATDWNQETKSFHEYFLPPQSGIVAIHGPMPVVEEPYIRCPKGPKTTRFLDALEHLCRQHAVSLFVASYEPIYIGDLAAHEEPLDREDWCDQAYEEPLNPGRFAQSETRLPAG
jgi:hypothetical protein